jgi:hypothetical protein
VSAGAEVVELPVAFGENLRILIASRPPFDLFLFSTDPVTIRTALPGGLAGVVVDWERRGKRERQAGVDTQIGTDTREDLQRVRAATQARILCRIEGFGPTTEDDVEAAANGGADEVLLPMVRGPSEVEAVLEQVRGRMGVGILVETVDALRTLEDLSRLPCSRVYVGLNDLAIGRRSGNLFEAIADGTVASIRRHFRVPFGFAGLTLPGAGYPIPCRLVLGEMARLACGFSFLRRSFHRDVRGRDSAAAIASILSAFDAAGRRPPERIRMDAMELQEAIAAWQPEGANV